MKRAPEIICAAEFWTSCSLCKLSKMDEDALCYVYEGWPNE